MHKARTLYQVSFCLLFFTCFLVLPESGFSDTPQKKLSTTHPQISPQAEARPEFDGTEINLNKLDRQTSLIIQRTKKVLEQGYGKALLRLPLTQTYKVYPFTVVDGEAIMGDIVLGSVREIIRQAVENRELGLQPGASAQSTPPGVLAPPVIPDASYRWLNNIVPYTINEKDFNQQEINTITAALESLDRHTNITLVPRENKERDYIAIVGSKKISGAGMSPVGRQGGKQKLTLTTSEDKNFDQSTVKHEMLHALGFYHEQNRSDRSQYIKVLWDNIEKGEDHNFTINDNRTFGEYDYTSIMHYRPYSFGRSCHQSDYDKNGTCPDCSIPDLNDFLAAKASNSGECTLKTLESLTSTQINRSSTLTQQDIASVNAVYPEPITKKGGHSLPPLTQIRSVQLTLEKIDKVAGSKGESGALCGSEPDFIGELSGGDLVETLISQDTEAILMKNEVTLSKIKKKDKEVGSTVHPNWSLSLPVSANQKELYLITKVWEYDDAACGGKNDLVDISPQSNQAYLRLILDTETGELSHVRAKNLNQIGPTYYIRAKSTGQNVFDPVKGKFISVSFSGLGDGSADDYQMEAEIQLRITIQ